MSTVPGTAPADFPEGPDQSDRHGRAVKVGISIPQDLANAVDAELAQNPGTSKSAFYAEALRLLLRTRDDARLAEQAALLDDGEVEDWAFGALR